MDFYCSSKRICIEIDGESHELEEVIEYDIIRTEYLETA
jgi:very-short-patch-repair endonuclease